MDLVKAYPGIRERLEAAKILSEQFNNRDASRKKERSVSRTQKKRMYADEGEDSLLKGDE